MHYDGLHQAFDDICDEYERRRESDVCYVEDLNREPLHVAGVLRNKAASLRE